MKKIFLALIIVLCALSLSSCVRLTGVAGYSKVNATGEATSKQVGFDTNKLVPGDKTSGSITT